MYKMRQKGYLLVSAVIIIVIVGLLATTVAYLVITESFSSTMRLDSTRAFYIARSGLELSAYRLLGKDLSQRISCSDITGHADLTNRVLFTPPNEGSFTAEGIQVYETTSDTRSYINTSATIIPIDALKTYVLPRGRVLIDREAIDYRGISDQSADCANDPPCLFDVTRGVGGTSITNHSAGTPIAQNTCIVKIDGIVPPADSVAKRTIIGEVKQLEEGWIVGDVSGYESIIRFDGDDWTRANATVIPNVNLNDVEILSYADTWGVGSGGTIIHWNGGSWSTQSSTTVNNLNGISCVNHFNCHAVGDNKTFLYSNGYNNWATAVIDVGVPNVNINDVSCYDESHCKAVGDIYPSGSGGDDKAVFAFWDSSSWKKTTDSNSDDPTQNMRSISCLSDNFCKAVGDNGTFMRFDGTNWVNESASVGISANMKSVYCIDHLDCWAVGDSNTFAHWIDFSWAIDTSVPSGNYNSVSCTDNKDCWAVGDIGEIAHFDGSSWTSFTPSTPFSMNLNGVCAIADHDQYDISWHEIFE